MKNTKTVTGRRTLHFDTLAEALADAEQITAQPHHALGNWNAAENLDHVAKPIFWCIDGYPDGFPVPLPLKLLGPLLKGRFLGKPFPAGITPPKATQELFKPRPGVTLDQALDHFRKAVAHFQSGTTIPRNPLLGAMDRAQWERFQCRHAELHLSFIVPGEADGA